MRVRGQGQRGRGPQHARTGRSSSALAPHFPVSLDCAEEGPCVGCRSPPREGPAHSCRWGGPARRDGAAPRTSAAGSLCARPGSHRPERRPRAARRRGRSKVGPSPTPFTWAAVRLTGPTVRELPSRGRRPEVTRGPQHKKLGTRPPRTPTLIGNDRQTSGRNPEISEPSVPSPPEAGRTGRQQVGGPAGRSPCPAPPGLGAVCRGALRTVGGGGRAQGRARRADSAVRPRRTP